MFKLFEHGGDPVEAEYINRIILYWHPDYEYAYFEPFFTLVETYGVRVVEATFIHSKYDSEKRPGIEFVVRGTGENLLKLTKACLYDPNMEQFIPRFYP